MSSILLATCSDLPVGEVGDESTELLAACARAGSDARWAVWDDPSVRWNDADLVVVRSVWDYTRRREEFLTWAGGVDRLANPVAILAWNSDKTYLRELADAGVPIVPTSWAAVGESVTLPADTDFVVKPAVGAGSVGAGRFSAADPQAPEAARRHIEALHRLGRTVMVQPYLGDVDEHGETALVFLGGRYSHAIRKASMLPEPVVHDVGAGTTRELFVEERISAREPSPAERRVAEQVLAAVPGADELLYARVDLLPTPDGPVLIELELTEPSLFLRYGDGAADRFAAAIQAAGVRRDAATGTGASVEPSA